MKSSDNQEKLPVIVGKDGSHVDNHIVRGQPLVQRGKWGLGNLFGTKSQILRSSLTPQQFRAYRRYRKAIFVILIADVILIGWCAVLFMQRL